MESINLLSLFVFVGMAFAGAIAHWYKKKRRGEIQGKLVDYLFADYPGNTRATGAAIVVAAVGAVMTGALAGLDMQNVLHAISAGNFPMPAAHVLSSAFTLGWMADSALNRGAKA